MVIVSNPRTFKIPDWFLNRCGTPARTETDAALTRGRMTPYRQANISKYKLCRGWRATVITSYICNLKACRAQCQPFSLRATIGTLRHSRVQGVAVKSSTAAAAAAGINPPL